MPRLSVQMIRFVLNTCCPCHSLEFWPSQADGALSHQPPVKALSLSLGRNPACMLPHSYSWEQVCLCGPHWRDSTRRLHVDTPRPTTVPYSPPEYHIYATELHLSCANISLPIPVSLSRGSLNMGLVLGTPETHRDQHYFLILFFYECLSIF